MTSERVDISARGRRVTVAGVRVGERIVIVSSGWLKTAELHDEAWLEDDVDASPGKPSHYDKRPANALLARAIEICHAKGLTYHWWSSSGATASRSVNVLDTTFP